MASQAYFVNLIHPETLELVWLCRNRIKDCHPERSLARSWRQTKSKDLRFLCEVRQYCLLQTS